MNDIKHKPYCNTLQKWRDAIDTWEHSMTMDEIRENHGSEKIKEVKRQRIA